MQQEEMNLKEFMNRFQTEQDCQEYFFHLKWPNGFKCCQCGHEKYWLISGRKLYQCRECGHQASLTAGTLMHKSHTGLREWFLAIYLFTHDKRGISATQLARTLGVSYYTAWLMLHKLREAMGTRDEEYLLKGIVEMDDAFFGASSENGKRGRGTDKTPAIIGVSLDNDGNPGYVKIEVVDNVNGVSVVETAQAMVEAGSEIRTDGLSSYNALKKEGYEHHPENFDPKNHPEHLRWLHVIVSNLKAFIAGTYHGLEKKHLQRYCNEFCYRFNRRRFDNQLFNRLLSVSISMTTTVTYAQLVGIAEPEISR